MSAIHISNLRFTWPGAAQLTLDVPQFRVARGESVFLQGASGSGKSTLLSLLAGILTAGQGTVSVLDTDLGALSARKRDRFRAEHIGIVFQQFNLVPFLTVGGNLRLASRFAGRKTSYSDEQASQLLDALRLDPALLHRRSDRLSVGQQQRVAIARAFINEPEILLADEPTSALDADARDQFMRLLLEVRESTGCTMIFASHDDSLAKFFATRATLSQINRVSGKEVSHA